jgi:simple sugar transport system ATP-binding protein
VAIARAVYFGAKVLILDEPTSALGVKEAAVVLKYIVQAKTNGIGVIFITHNVHHAWAVGDAFTVLNRGRSYGTVEKKDTDREQLLGLMAGARNSKPWLGNWILSLNGTPGRAENWSISWPKG